MSGARTPHDSARPRNFSANAERPERWRPVPLDGLAHVEVSDRGRVRTAARVVVDRNGRRAHYRQRELSLRPRPNGYVAVRVGNGTPTGIQLYVHRLVALAFLPNPDGKPTVNHRDSDPANNHVENLEWATPAENTAHAVRAGRMCCGEASPCSKLTEAAVRSIRRRPRARLVDLAAEFGVSPPTVHRVRWGQGWTHVRPDPPAGRSPGDSDTSSAAGVRPIQRPHPRRTPCTRETP